MMMISRILLSVKNNVSTKLIKSSLTLTACPNKHEDIWDQWELGLE